MIIIREKQEMKEATGSADANKRKRIAVGSVEVARKDLRKFACPAGVSPDGVDYLLLYCDIMMEMGANLDLLSKSPANDFLRKTSREITSYAVNKVKELSLL